MILKPYLEALRSGCKDAPMRRIQEIQTLILENAYQMKQIRDLQDFVKGQPATITEFDETPVKRLITKITVVEDDFTVEFKSGVTIEIKA